MKASKRIALTWRFFKQAPLIELEQQKIEQNKNDALCSFETTMMEGNKQDHCYKSGVSDGVKLILKRFSLNG